MKRRAFLSASAAVPLAGITAALPFAGVAGVAGSKEEPDIEELLDILETLPPDLREYVFSYARFLAESGRKRRAGVMQ